MASSSLFTLVVREAADALAVVDSGCNYDHIISVGDHGHFSSKFPLLLRHCTLNSLNTLNGVETLSRSTHTSESLCRVVLKHNLFGERLLEAVSASFHDMFSFGASGGCTKCRWISEEEARNLQPLRSLWHLYLPSSPP
jgi:hypothetical protein